MKVILHALIFLLLSPAIADSQIFKKIKYQAEAGLGISIGPNTFAVTESEINPFDSHHFNHKRYRVPTVRIRGFAYKPLNEWVNFGLRTGIDVHYLERNVYGEYETNISVPIQLVSEIRTIHINKDNDAFAGVGFGWNLKKLSHEPYSEKTGILVSFEISINKNMKSKTIYYKAGFEYGEENCGYHYVPRDTYLIEETLKYKQHRKQLYAIVGVNL